MAATKKPELFVVDGSNIATEGRNTPSLEQLNDAVLAFIDAHPHAIVTVVVDATFGHRIAKKEATAFDEAVANNELVTPPAGAVGRGDAFVLAIADRAKAGILSNDSFQEFHGEYDWLFDEGRLIGGKPVPHVGWVFVKRSPVRGPKSRQAIREATDDAKSTKEQANRRVRKRAAEPADAVATDSSAEPIDAVSAEPAAEPPAKESARRGRRGRGRKQAAEPIGDEQQATIDAAKAVTAPKEHINELMPFLEFVQHHPVGTSCTVVVDSYSSHGAYARVDDVLVYIPLRLMDDPVPRSARSVLNLGDAITTVIVGYVPDRRSIDAALPHMVGDVASTETQLSAAEPGDAPGTEPSTDQPRTKRAPAKKTAAKKTPAKKTPAKKTPAKKTPAKKTLAKSTAAKQSAAEQTPAKETSAGKTAAKQAPAKKTAAKQAPAKTTAGKTTAAKAMPAKKSPAKTTAAKQSAAKQVPAKRASAGKTAAKQVPAKKTAAKKTAAKKTGAKKTSSASSPGRS